MNSDVLYTHALAEHNAGRLSTARDLYCKVLQAAPLHLEALHGLGALTLQAGEVATAVDCLRAVLKRNPEHVAALANLGEALRRLGAYDEAIAYLSEALSLSPGLAEVHGNLGLALWEKGEWLSSKKSLESALNLNPELPEAHNTLGLIELSLGHKEAATACFHAALKRRPHFPEAEVNLANILRTQGRLGEAIARYRNVLRNRSHPEAANNLGTALMAQGDLEEAMACFSQAVQWRSDFPLAQSNYLFALNYCSKTSPAKIFEAHRAWGAGLPLAERRDFSKPRDPEKRLLVGYVSPDFRVHAVARFLEPIVRNHNASIVETILFADVANPDYLSERLQGLASRWHNTYGISDDYFANLVLEEQIDILVDLTGHTANHRLGAFARRIAPVQITYLGYPNTTGLGAMDYRFTEAVADPPGAETAATEQLVKLPGPYCCYQLPVDAPPVTTLPARDRGHITFGSPHNLSKIHAGVLDLWARILNALPTSRLFFFRGELTPEAIQRLSHQLHQRGIDLSRLDFKVLSSATVGYTGYLAAYGAVDLVLDTFPANAGTTACEALFMGIPLISLYGDRFYGRLSASLLYSLGLQDWVARSPEDYVSLALRKAQDLQELGALRARLRALAQERLGDGRRFTLQLEETYRTLWCSWCHDHSHGGSKVGEEKSGQFRHCEVDLLSSHS